MTVDPDRAAVHEALDPLRTGRLEQVARSIEVDRLEKFVTLSTLTHGDGEMEDVGCSPRRAPAELGIGDAAGQYLGSQPGQKLGVALFLGSIG
jgi:hypothetical protein